ncbi:hypothetical protein D3C85_1354030 [compost metagenome]
MKEDYLVAPIPDVTKNAANFPKPELKDLADSFSRTVIEKPIPERKSEVTEVKKLEAAIAKPKPAWWEVMQAALLGKGDVKVELQKYTAGMNKRLDDAIKQAQDKGLKVSKEDFASPQFDGLKDFKN